MYRLTKLGADGAALADDATDHVAVQLDHPLLAKPIVWAARRSPKRMTWKKSQNYAAKLDTAGWARSCKACARRRQRIKAGWTPEQADSLPVTPPGYTPVNPRTPRAQGNGDERHG